VKKDYRMIQRNIRAARLIEHPRSIGADPTRFSELAHDIEAVQCADHDETATIDAIVDDLIAVRGCCELLLAAISKHVAALRT
jgi:hypothetical protein